jgi:hypothetical protein
MRRAGGLSGLPARCFVSSCPTGRLPVLSKIKIAQYVYRPLEGMKGRTSDFPIFKVSFIQNRNAEGVKG